MTLTVADGAGAPLGAGTFTYTSANTAAINSIQDADGNAITQLRAEGT